MNRKVRGIFRSACIWGVGGYYYLLFAKFFFFFPSSFSHILLFFLLSFGHGEMAGVCVRACVGRVFKIFKYGYYYLFLYFCLLYQ